MLMRLAILALLPLNPRSRERAFVGEREEVAPGAARVLDDSKNRISQRLVGRLANPAAQFSAHGDDGSGRLRAAIFKARRFHFGGDGFIDAACTGPEPATGPNSAAGRTA